MVIEVDSGFMLDGGEFLKKENGWTKALAEVCDDLLSNQSSVAWDAGYDIGRQEGREDERREHVCSIDEDTV